VFERGALIHYHEIGLKGRNRSTFENRLRQNIAFATSALTGENVERIASRLLLRSSDPDTHEALLRACAAVPGVAHVSDVLTCARDLSEIGHAARVALEEEIDRAGGAASFAVDARRSSTDFATSSSQMNIAVGRELVDALGLRVDLGDPDVTVRVEVVQGGAYVSARRLAGPGGLPVGSSGRVVSLLSAGIDSPVATWRMIKRGAVVVAVHFSGAPFTSDTSTADVHDIAGVLAPAAGLERVYSVPFGELQREIMLATPPDLRVLLYRRLMVRVAEAVARSQDARALVTGESLGQVASQTLDNIVVTDAAATMPVLRPLIGTDKQEIITQARRLGTYEISCRPHDDCCTLYLPRSPETHATLEQVEQAESLLDVARMVADALAGATQREFPCAVIRSSSGRSAVSGTT
jgi:thiamine biosynthesis protein ThiI